MICLLVSRSRTHFAKPCFLINAQWIYMFLHISKKWFWSFPKKQSRCLLWHGFWMSLGIDFGSILILIWHKVQSCLRVFFNHFWDRICQKWFQQVSVWNNMFAPFYDPVPQECFWRSLGSFWHPFGSILVPFGSLLAPCRILSAPFGSSWHPFVF